MGRNHKRYDAFYQEISRPFRSGHRPEALLAAERILTGIMYAAYPLLLVYLLLRRPEELIRAILIPGVSFLILTAVRKIINRPRPYEAWDIQPLIPRAKKGESMPSRHVFSTAVIAMAYLFYFPGVGIAFLIVGLAAALIRVVAGIHYPSDAAVGYAAGILAGIFFFI